MNSWLVKEQKVREILSKRFNKVLKEMALPLGRKPNGETKMHKFDLVSSDRKLVGEVKASKFSNKTTGKSGYSSTRRARLLEACFYLANVKSAKKYLVLTNEDLYREFNEEMGLLLRRFKIEILHVSV